MDLFYEPPHRRFQDERETRRLADRLAEMAHPAITGEERGFIESRTMLFLATVGPGGRPTVSYKGGAPGFVRVVDDRQIAFPSYDGNGMYLSLGNIAAHRQVGILFIDFEQPRRLRLQGAARVGRDDPLLAVFPGAQYVVRVDCEVLFVNCGRYIHRMDGSRLSPHLPDSRGMQPLPAWKKLDLFNDALNDEDRRRVEQGGGPIPREAYPGEDI